MKRAKKRFQPYFKIALNCSRTRSKDQFLYANVSATIFGWCPLTLVALATALVKVQSQVFEEEHHNY